MPKVAVVLNRCASHLGDGSRASLALEKTAALGARIFATRSLAELDEAARAIARERPDVIVLAGGDGSYTAGVTAVHRAYGGDEARLPAFAFAPGGTASTVARNWGLRRATPRAGERLVRAAIDGAPALPRPTLRIEDDDGRDFVGFIFGAGLVASFFDVYYASPHQGYAGAARIVAKVFAGSFVRGRLAERVMSPVAARLVVDGVLAPAREFSLVVASVVRDLGLGMKPAYRAGERFDRVHVVASALPPWALGPQMPRVLAGRPLKHAAADAMAAAFELTFDAERGPYVVDGEVLRAKRVRVSPGPEIRVVERY